MLRLCLALICLVAPLRAADLTGVWTGTLTAGGSARPFVFEFRQAGGAISGAFGTRTDFQWPLEDARLAGAILTFKMKAPMGGPGASFEGALAGDAISGQLASGAPALTGKLELKRTGPPSRLPASIANPASAADFAALSDEFDSPDSLRNWKNLSDTESLPNRIEKIDIGKTSPGHLAIVPQSGAWWAGYHGAYLYKEVKGNFVVTTRLKVTGKIGGEPTAIWTISGLLLRAPGDLNAASRSTSRELDLLDDRPRSRSRPRGRRQEHAGRQQRLGHHAGAKPGWYELRVARLGPLFVAMCRPDGGDWVLRKRIFRADLPETLQAGINVTSDFKLSASMPAAKYNAALFPEQSSGDSLTTFDYVRFSRVAGAPGLRAKLSGADVLGVSDADLLALFQ